MTIHFIDGKTRKTPCEFAYLYKWGEHRTELNLITCEECLNHPIYLDALAQSMEDALENDPVLRFPNSEFNARTGDRVSKAVGGLYELEKFLGPKALGLAKK